MRALRSAKRGVKKVSDAIAKMSCGILFGTGFQRSLFHGTYVIPRKNKLGSGVTKPSDTSEMRDVRPFGMLSDEVGDLTTPIPNSAQKALRPVWGGGAASGGGARPPSWGAWVHLYGGVSWGRARRSPTPISNIASSCATKARNLVYFGIRVQVMQQVPTSSKNRQRLRYVFLGGLVFDLGIGACAPRSAQAELRERNL
jgi:hypothetical protein